VDFAPTFLDLAGHSMPDEMQGRSFRALLHGDTPPGWPRSLYYRYWMHLAHHHVCAHYGVRTERHKLIYYYGQACGQPGAADEPTEPEWELFDLEKDPLELRNVYSDPAYAGEVKQLAAELDRLRREVGDRD
jgi:arylsulfatase A-like enzyme